MRTRIVMLSVVALAWAVAASAEVAELQPVADTTLFEEDGDLGNGAGSYIFVGRTESRNGSWERRALLEFDVASSIPNGATVTEVSLELTMSRTISGPQSVELRRVTEDWSEGSSDAPGQEGGGTSAENGDATWTHRSYPDTTWSNQGGSFEDSASGSESIAGVGSYVFSSTAEMVADVQMWLDDPESNFGWAMVMPSPPTASAKRFNSRDNSSESSRPLLTVTYETGGRDGELAERYVFPASNAEGAGTSFFVTTVDILNAGSSTATVRMQLLERDTDNSGAVESSSFTLEPGEVRRFDNALGEAFGAEGEDFAGGAAALSDSAELLVMTRTFNVVEGGSIGAALPAPPESGLVQAGDRATVLFLTENSEFRSNLGFLNGVASEVTVEWELFDAQGTSLATGSMVLPPYGVTQINRVLRQFRPIEAAYAEVWTDTDGGSFACYASVIDEGTGDPTIVNPR